MPLDWETRENGGAQLSLIESAPEKDQIKTLIDLVNRETKDQKWTPLMVVDFDGRGFWTFIFF
jgi:hypothetical protein